MYQEIRVKTLLNDVYRKAGRDPYYKGGHNDPNSLSSLELVARRKAYRALEVSDRVKLDKMADVICEKTGFGTDAALSVLMRLGIYLDACEKRMK